MRFKDGVLGAITVPTGSKVVHNTFVDVTWAFPQMDFISCGRVVNNLFFNTGVRKGGNAFGEFSGNGWLGTTPEPVAGDGDVIGADPRLNSAFSLSDSSPVSDKGASITADFD